MATQPGARPSTTVTLLCFDGGGGSGGGGGASSKKTIYWCDSEPTLSSNEQDYLVKSFLSSVSLSQALSLSTDDIDNKDKTTAVMPVYIQGRDVAGGLQSIVGIPMMMKNNKKRSREEEEDGCCWCWCVMAAPYRSVTVEMFAAVLHKHEGNEDEGEEEVNSGVRRSFNEVCDKARSAIRGESEHAKVARCQYITQHLLAG